MASLDETRMIYNTIDIYYNTPIRDGAFLDFYQPRNITIADDDEFIVLEKRHEFRPHVLAYDLYSNDKLWWIFARLNMDTLKDPIRDMQVGTVLRVPSPNRISTLFI